MLKNIIVSLIVALVVGSIAGGITGHTPAPVSNFGAIPTGDTVTNLQRFANDMLVSGNRGTTTVSVTSPTLPFGGCIDVGIATTTATTNRQVLQFYSTSTVPTGYNGIVYWKYGTCETSGI